MSGWANSSEAFAVGRDLLIDGGAGDNAVQSFATLRVARNVLITSQGGNDQTELHGQLAVGGNVTVLGGGGDNSTVISPDFGTHSIGGDLLILNGPGSNSNFVADTKVGGDVTFANGGADPAVGFTSNFFGASFSSERVTVGDDVTFFTRSGPSSNTLTDTDIGADVTVVAGGPGASTVAIGPGSIGGAATIGGAVTIRVGGQAQVALGDRPFAATGGLDIRGSLSVRTGAGDDELTLAEVRVRRDTDLATDGGADRVLIDDSTFGRAFSLATGGGADEVRIESQLSLTLGGATEFRKEVSVDLGGGDDILQLGVAGDPTRVVRLRGPARFDGGPGSDLRDDANVDRGKQPVRFVSFERTAPPPIFLGPVSYPVGNYVLGLVTADFNGDGKLDLVSANHDDDTVSLLLGKGDGTLAAAVPIDAGPSPQGLAVADFNGDGRPDLAVANNFGPNGTVSVLLGHGDGTFGPRTAFRAGSQVAPVQVAVGDFNRDGRADLVTVNRTGRIAPG